MCQKSRKNCSQLILYRYSRMTLGIKNGPSIFQSVMDQVLPKLDKVFCYLNDIIIGGSFIEGCREKLFEVLRRLEWHNFWFNRLVILVISCL